MRLHHYQYPREHIVLRICQVMIAVVLLQSTKLIYAPVLDNPLIQTNVLNLHIGNMCIHLTLFVAVLYLLKKGTPQPAKLLLVGSFCTYILSACLLWYYQLNLAYYFLLAMFISCYVFDHSETPLLSATIVIQLILFVLMLQQPTIYNIGELTRHIRGEVSYLAFIAQINSVVFAFSCVVCAIFIRHILAQNWQQLQAYEATQSLLLGKLFPSELMPPLLNAFARKRHPHTNDSRTLQAAQVQKQTVKQSDYDQNAMQRCYNMGVIFVDIVDFAELSQGHQSKPLNWQAIYKLFSQFDQVLSQFDGKRIKTNGDQYIVLVGLKSRGLSEQEIALQTLNVCRRLTAVSSVSVRIGAAFGAITCGVFDPNNPNFDIWGETVIRAARLEKLATNNQIAVDERLFALTSTEIPFEPPTKFVLKGLGQHQVYCVIKKP